MARRAFSPEAARVSVSREAVGSEATGHVRLGPQHADIREAVPAQRDREGNIQQDLARIVHRPRLPPRRQRH